MWTRMRFGCSIALIALIALCVTSCTSRTPKRADSLEPQREANDAYLAYERGDCGTVYRLADPEEVRTWPRNEFRFSTLLLNGYCRELAGEMDAALDIYEDVISDSPNSFAAADAKERSRIITINASNPSHAAWMQNARDRAKSEQDSAPRVPVERQAAQYPPIAQTSGIQGYAVVEFGITPNGKTSDPIVIDSKPPYVFDGAAVRAIRKWEYTRKGSAEKNDFQVIRLIFTDDDSAPTPRKASNSKPNVDADENL